MKLILAKIYGQVEVPKILEFLSISIYELYSQDGCVVFGTMWVMLKLYELNWRHQ